ncbi:hypothetical protein ACFQ2B_21885 [Streptomyces stramineus]
MSRARSRRRKPVLSPVLSAALLGLVLACAAAYLLFVTVPGKFAAGARWRRRPSAWRASRPRTAAGRWRRP